ncbi:MAG: alpha/beta hydrolase [Planctomycetota bacterium]
MFTRSTRRTGIHCLRYTIVIWLALAGACRGAVEPPAQSPEGPGGASYKHAEVSFGGYGEGGERFVVFKPAGPVPSRAPVVVFCHGWGAVDPAIYGAWIEHIVRRGNIVVFPRYQAGLRTRPTEMTPNAILSVKRALELLGKEKGPEPDLEKFAVVGHSLGAVIAANIARDAAGSGLPRVRALMVVEPGDSNNSKMGGSLVPSILGDYATVPGEMLVLVLVGEDDRVVRDAAAKRIFYGMSSVGEASKDFVVVRSDAHGMPALWADHRSPAAFNAEYHDAEAAESGRAGRLIEGIGTGERGVDALDYYGYWKLFDALCDLSFYGENREAALGGGPAQRFMGKWSDGVAVKELVVTDKP